MGELIQGISTLTFWEMFTDFHGAIAMFTLVLFGACIVLYKAVSTNIKYLAWLKNGLLLLVISLLLLNFIGLTIYAPYRTTEGQSPRTVLKSSEDTSWIHGIVFEHKEFLAFAPLLLILIAYLATLKLGNEFNSKEVEYLRKSVIFSLFLALIIVFLVAGEAVIVTKAQPLR